MFKTHNFFYVSKTKSYAQLRREQRNGFPSLRRVRCQGCGERIIDNRRCWLGRTLQMFRNTRCLWLTVESIAEYLVQGILNVNNRKK